MKKLIVLRILTVLLLLVGAVSAYAQDPRLAGVWKRHCNSDHFEYDTFIRVDIDESRVFVAIKEMGNFSDGSPFQRYMDARDITVNSDGSVSFNIYLMERELDEDHLYRTVWASFTIRAEGRRLNVTKRGHFYSENSHGRIIERCDEPLFRYTYFNINDNW